MYSKNKRGHDHIHQSGLFGVRPLMNFAIGDQTILIEGVAKKFE